MNKKAKVYLIISLSLVLLGLIVTVFKQTDDQPQLFVFLPVGAVFFGLFLVSSFLAKEADEHSKEQDDFFHEFISGLVFCWFGLFVVWFKQTQATVGLTQAKLFASPIKLSSGHKGIGADWLGHAYTNNRPPEIVRSRKSTGLS